MVCPRRSTCSLKIGLLAVALCCSLNSARAEYRLQGGDVVEISVSGVPDLRQRAPVQLDGSITFPVIGTFMVEGVDFSDVRGKIQSAVASKIFRIRSPDGREFSRTFEREEVAATIVEYRPVFITGDVTRAGEQPFRPRMTVRQALATAGGFSALARGTATSFDMANLRSEYVTVWLNLAREHVRVWRIRTELGENIELDQKAIPPAPLPDAVRGQQFFVFIDFRRNKFDEFLYVLFETVIRFILQTADAESMCGQARAAIFLENLENFFPVAEGVEERRNGADVESMGPQPQLMAGHAVEFREYHANILRTRRRFHSQQLLD